MLQSCVNSSYIKGLNVLKGRHNCLNSQYSNICGTKKWFESLLGGKNIKWWSGLKEKKVRSSLRPLESRPHKQTNK